MRESIVRFREKKVMSTVEGVSRNEWYVYWRQKGGMVGYYHGIHCLSYRRITQQYILKGMY